MKNLLETMEEYPELKTKIEELDKNPDSTIQDFIKAATEYGVELTEADFAPTGSEGELADDELEAVSGGLDEYACACFMGGGGEAGHNKRHNKTTNTCACVLGGGGEYKDGKTRCVCVLYGDGYANGNTY